MPLRGKSAAHLVFMAYAVIRTGGKQYRVEPGSLIRVEKLDGDVGASVEFTEVLLAGGDAIRIVPDAIRLRICLRRSQRGHQDVVTKS